MKVIVVEDANDIFENIKVSLKEAGITDIERASNGHEANVLVRKMQEKAIWIIDGLLPMYTDGSLRILGLNITDNIRCRRSGKNEVLIGFSSDPKIFKNLVGKELNYVFDKSFSGFHSSMEEIVQIILDQE